MDIILSPEILKAAPGLRVLAIEADVDNFPTSDELWSEISALSDRIHKTVEMPMANKLPSIAATREAYKACGKEPNRYRPSAEALRRRAVKGLELYRTLTVIDLINLISLDTGHSIGGFDADKISGSALVLGIGKEGEEFEAIGRGALNIAGLPIYRDEIGGIGTPTSDCERTKLTQETTHLLMLVNIYDETTSIDELSSMLAETFDRHGLKITREVVYQK